MSPRTAAPAVTSAGSLVLVNAAHPLCAPVPQDALCAPFPAFPDICLERTAASLLTRLLVDIGAEAAIVPVSGHRTQEAQEGIYAGSLKENGAAFTRQYVALPGCSEHQTGLAIDLALNAPDIDFIRPAFPESGVCGTFRRRAAAYGFIERYPAGREHVTGIAHEPWHFRYVGVPHAALMVQNGLTLEEYIPFLRGEKHICLVQNNRAFEVWHLAPEDVPCARAELSQVRPFQLSGDNCGGVILTVWGAAV